MPIWPSAPRAAWTLEQLLTFDAGSEDLEDADAEPSADDEEDGPPVVVDLLRPRTVTRTPALASGCPV